MTSFREKIEFGTKIRIHFGTELGPRRDPGDPVRERMGQHLASMVTLAVQHTMSSKSAKSALFRQNGPLGRRGSKT